MKEIERKNIIDLPYSLHDARVNKINIVSDKVLMYFNEGYYKIDDDCELVKGYIEFNNVDLDYCSIFINLNTSESPIKISTNLYLVNYLNKIY